MKKILSTLVFVFFTYCIYGQTTFEVGGIKYTAISATEVKISPKSPSYSGSIIIPETVEYSSKTYKITSIGNEAFSNCSGLTSISIPNSVTCIEDFAFWGCYSLTTISIPNLVTSIGNYAFSNCSGLNTISIPNSVASIGNSTFQDCSGITSISMSNSVKIIGNNAFSSCNSITSIIIPDSVDSIGNNAFTSCKNLESIILPKNTKIGYSIIGSCDKLKKIISPASIFDIDLRYNMIPEISNILDTLVLLSGEIEHSKFPSNKTLRYIDLSGTTNKELVDENLLNFYNLDSLLLPVNLEKIKYKEFAECISLRNINIPASVTEIGMRAFENCRSLKSVNFESNSQLKTINNWAFYACHGLQNITIPTGVTTVGDGAFWGCEYLSDLTLPSTVQKINDNGFDGCIGLNKIKVEATLPPAVSAKTFNRVNKNAAIYVPDASVSIYKNTFGWKDFLNIKGISTQVQELNEPRYGIRVINKNIEITNAEGEAVELFDVAGRMIFKKSNADNQQTISLQQKGVYLLKIGDFKKKIMID